MSKKRFKLCTRCDSMMPSPRGILFIENPGEYDGHRVTQVQSGKLGPRIERAKMGAQLDFFFQEAKILTPKYESHLARKRR
jgi:hypothetical protein